MNVLNLTTTFLPSLDQISNRFASVGEALGSTLASVADKTGGAMTSFGDVVSTAFTAGVDASSSVLANTGGMFVNTGMSIGSVSFPGFPAPSATSAVAGFASFGLTAGAFFASLASQTTSGIIEVSKVAVTKVQALIPSSSQGNLNSNTVAPDLNPESITTMVQTGNDLKSDQNSADQQV